MNFPLVRTASPREDATIEDMLRPGVKVRHLDGPDPVEIVEVSWIGDAATVVFRDDRGIQGRRMLLPDDVAQLEPDGDRATFDADPDRFRLAIEAVRLRHAHLLDPYMAVSAANVEPLPHQLQAVYDEMLTRRPLRFLLADDPGAGKTIMCGLLVKELLARGSVRRCLVLAPGGLVDQWQDELQYKFGLHFPIFDRSMLDGTNPFVTNSVLLARVDQLARADDLKALLAASRWDLVVIDEAHKLTASYWGSNVVKTKRYQLGEVAAEVSSNLLLMTATPHSGKEEQFQLFLALLDRDRYVGRARNHDQAGVDDVMRRLVKEQLVHVDGRPLFPERRASTVTYELSEPEAELYERVSDYVRHEMDKVTGDDRRRSVGFALLVLQRRLASSPQAILTSLRRRRDRLAAEVERVVHRDANLGDRLLQSLGDIRPDDDDSQRPEEREVAEEKLADAATASRTVVDIEAEILLLDDLVRLAQSVLDAGVDRKWDELERLLRSDVMFDEDGRRRKIIVFTEHRDTLDYLEHHIHQVLAGSSRIEVIHGSVSRQDRRLAQQNFIEDPDTTVLLATDAAGEGVNLQVAHLMVNYDIPWNPNRLEQRFGRIHRIGQTEVCHLWNLVASNTREGDVFETLLDKLEVQRAALGDRVFDVLGDVLSGQDLRGLLTEALQYGDRPDVRARLERTLSQRLEADLRDALDEREESVGELTDEDLAHLRRQMALSRVHRLQPRVVEGFVRGAMAASRTDVADQPDKRLTVRHVPPDVREAGKGVGVSVERRYPSLTFAKEAIDTRGRQPAELLAPGHTLVDALVEHALVEHADALRRGVVLRDDWQSEDSVVVTYVHTIRSPSNAWPPSRRLTTVRSGSTCRQVDAAVYTSLPTDRVGDMLADVDALLDAAGQHVGEEVAREHEADLRSRFEGLHRRAAADVERRLTVERAALEERLGRTGMDDVETQSMRDRIRALDQRLVRRLDELRDQSELEVGDAELVAVAYVHGTADPGRVETQREAQARVRETLADRVLGDGLPFGGYDLAIEDEGRHRFVTVARETSLGHVELDRAEMIAASNLGEDHLLALVDGSGDVRFVPTTTLFDGSESAPIAIVQPSS